MTIAELISKGIVSGLPHPGGGDQPPMTIRLPLFKSAAFAPEVQRQIDETTRLLGEAIVYLIETEGRSEIVGRDELARLRQTAEAPPPAPPRKRTPPRKAAPRKAASQPVKRMPPRARKGTAK